MELIRKYFPKLNQDQIKSFHLLNDLYQSWNNKINVISRKDINDLYLKHVLHSLGIAKFVTFTNNSSIIDVGTGGGFPGIPLAIIFPDCQFHLIDSIGKKINVVNSIIESLDLKNVTAEQKRIQDIKTKYDFVVSRAVTAFPDFVRMTRHVILPKGNNAISNGILYLKGGEFNDELKGFRKNCSVIELSDYFDEPFFETKKLIHLSL